MSMHKIPLTKIEEDGLRAHGLDIGTPSQLSDVFRQGIAWAQNYAALQQPAAIEQHGDDLAVDRFAAAMKEKLARKREQGRGGWDNKEKCSAEFLSRLLVEHIGKGDPVDVANFAMMLHQRGERIQQPAAPDLSEEAAFSNWFQSQQGKPFDTMWQFAKAAWMFRAAQPCVSKPAKSNTQPDSCITDETQDIRQQLLAFVPPVSEWPEGAAYWCFDGDGAWFFYSNSPSISEHNIWWNAQRVFVCALKCKLPEYLFKYWQQSLLSRDDVLKLRGW